MPMPIRCLALGLAMVLGLAVPGKAQTVNEGDFGRDVQRPTLMEPIGQPSSSVRPPAPDERALEISSQPKAEWAVTRMSDPSDASSSVRLNDPATAEMPGDTLRDVLARQKPASESAETLLKQVLFGGTPGATMPVDPASTPAAANPEAAIGPLAVGGAHNDAEIWSAIRNGQADTDTQVRGPATGTLIQDGGMPWLQFRSGPLLHWGGWLLVGTLAVVAAFFLFRGRIRIQGRKTGRTIERFAFIERFGHWLTAGSFILLAVTGLLTLFGRIALIPLIGHAAYSPVAIGSKWVHNNVSWAFMAGLILIFVLWAGRNIPRRVDLQWIAKGGGLFSKNSHPHAGKFNAGQKMVFWAVALLGVSISLSGLSLLFPFDLHLFPGTFAWINGIFGTHLPEVMSPQHEMQLAQTWHAVIAFIFMAIIVPHIYIGSVGMEGAFDAMGSGEVEVQWAVEHHDLWFEKVTGRKAQDYMQNGPSRQGSMS
ncbi:MAG: formate dehydrogenase subunit gamma [Geminicoccaceae bacterium]